MTVDIQSEYRGKLHRPAAVLRGRRAPAVRHQCARQRGDKSYLAALDGTRDRQALSAIVAALPADTPVTTPRHHVQYVVTEYVVASLGMLTARARREALSAIGHPDVRAALRAA